MAFFLQLRLAEQCDGENMQLGCKQPNKISVLIGKIVVFRLVMCELKSFKLNKNVDGYVHTFFAVVIYLFF